MGLFSALFDQLNRNDVNHAHGSDTLPKTSRGTPSPSLTSIYLYSKAKRASTAHPSHAQHQQIPSKIEAGKDQLKAHRKRKAVEAVGGEEKVSKKIKVKKPEQDAESDAILSHAVSSRSPGHRRQSNRKEDKSKKRSKCNGGVAGLLKYREGMIYMPDLAATPDLIVMVPRRSNVLGSSDTKHTPVAPQPRFSSFGPDTADHGASAAYTSHVQQFSTRTEAAAANSSEGLSVYDLIIEKANSKKTKAATSAEILASKSAKARIPKTKSLFGTNIALLPCTLLEELDKRQGSPLIAGDEHMYNTALKQVKHDRNPIEELWLHYAASARNPELPPVKASGVKRRMKFINADKVLPAIPDAVKSHYAQSTADCHYRTHKIQNHKIQNGTSPDAIEKGCECFKPSGSCELDRLTPQQKVDDGTQQPPINGRPIYMACVQKRKREDEELDCGDSDHGALVTQQAKRIRRTRTLSSQKIGALISLSASHWKMDNTTQNISTAVPQHISSSFS